MAQRSHPPSILTERPQKRPSLQPSHTKKKKKNKYSATLPSILYPKLHSLLCCRSIVGNDTDQHSFAVLWGSSSSLRSLEHTLKCDGRPLRCNLKDNGQRNTTQTAYLLEKLFRSITPSRNKHPGSGDFLYFAGRAGDRTEEDRTYNFSLFCFTLSHLQNDTSQRDRSQFSNLDPTANYPHTILGKAAASSCQLDRMESATEGFPNGQM